MTASGSFERNLAAWMAEEASGGPAEHVVEDLFVATRQSAQAPTFVARLREPSMRWHRRNVAGANRRQLALVAVVLLLALATAAVVGARLLDRSEGGDWLGYRGGPGRDGVGLVGPAGRPVLQWRFDAGAAVRENIAVVGDIVVVPGQDGVLHGVELSSGLERWSFSPGTSITGPTAAGSSVFVADGRGIVHSLDVATGNPLWHSGQIVTSASGVVTGDGKVFIGGGNGVVTALDIATGDLEWTATPATGAVHLPAFADGSVFAATDDGTFISLRGSDGGENWRASVGPGAIGTPIVAAGIAYVGEPGDGREGRLRALDARTGGLLWQIDEALYAPAVSGDLAVSASDVGIVSARDSRSGVERWRYESGGALRGPAIAGRVAYVGDDSGQRVVAIDATSGLPLWEFNVDGANACCVAVAKGFVFVGTMAGSVYAIGGDGSELSAGQPTLRATLPATPIASSSVRPSAPSLADPFTVVSRHTAAELGLARPLSLAVGPSGDLYITEASNRVTQLASDGTVIRRWGESGSGPSQFDFTPAQSNENIHGSIGVGPDGKVYVSDSDNHRVQVFAADGEFIREFGSVGSETGQFTIPFDVSADAGGSVYVIDDGLMRLTKFAATGEVVWAVDEQTDARLSGHAHDADIDLLGRIVIIIDETGRVLMLSQDGEIVDGFDAPGCDVTMDAMGRYYVAGCEGGVTAYDAEYRKVGESEPGMLAPQFGPGGQAAALTSDGSLVIMTVSPPGN